MFKEIISRQYSKLPLTWSKTKAMFGKSVIDRMEWNIIEWSRVEWNQSVTPLFGF